MVRKVRARGTCDACGKRPRVLTGIESGQRICRTCLRRLRQPKAVALEGPATPEQLSEAGALGLDLPPDATEHEAARLLSFARRQFEITAELLSEDHDRLIHLQDDVMCYVVDAWEQLTGRPPEEADIPGCDQQELAATIVMKQGDLARAIRRVQRQRERKRHALEAECGVDVAGDTYKQPVAEDDTYLRIVTMLKKRWVAYLPRKPGLLGRLLIHRQRAASGPTAPSQPAAPEEPE